MSTMKYLNENPKKIYTQATSLSEINQKATKCGIGLGKCLCEFADELRKSGEATEQISERVGELMGVPHDRIEPLGRIYRWYRAPKTAGLPVFEWYYLYRVELAVLDAFIPVLRHHLERVRKGLSSNVWLTKNSIEIALDSQGGGKVWYDLKELPLDKVIALGAAVSSPPVSAGTPQLKPPVAVSNQSVPVAVSQVEVSPAVIPTVAPEVVTETLMPSDSTSTASDIESGCMSNIEDGAADFFDDIDWDDANS